MVKKKDSVFHNPSKKGRMDFQKVIQEMIVFMHQDQERHYRIIIGTDSAGRGRVEFVSAIVIHRVGKGGRYFWKREYRTGLFNLRQRIHQEVSLSLDLAQKVLAELQKNLKTGKVSEKLEIHVDVGPNGETKEMIREVIGMVEGSGFNCRTKPESFGASCIADKYT